MPKIFISYRREDSQYQADRLHAALKRHVDDPRRDIFIDIDNIPIGVDFADHLDAQVAQCDVLLAVIGPSWLTVRNPKTGQRRLDDPKDFVRVEIASALKRGIPVAPVLLDGTPFPSEGDLPDDLKPLARRNGAEVRRTNFDADTERMIQGLSLGDQRARERTARQSKPAQGISTDKASDASRFVLFVIAGILLLVAGMGMWLVDPFGLKGPQIRPSVAIDAESPVTAAPVPTEPEPTTPGSASSRTLSARIDWDAARADRARAPVSAAAIVRGTGNGEPPLVPMLLPLNFAEFQGRPSPPVITPNGYFATYHLARYDAIVNGSVREESRRPTEAMRFTSGGAGAQVVFSRYGADYLIEFECNQAEGASSCITEQEALDFAGSLFVARTR